jgi:hypothetical protein
MQDPFKIVESSASYDPVDSSDVYGRGDDWIISKVKNAFVLSYLTGHFATEEKIINISEEEAEAIVSGKITLDSFLFSKRI